MPAKAAFGKVCLYAGRSESFQKRPATIIWAVPKTYQGVEKGVDGPVGSLKQDQNTLKSRPKHYNPHSAPSLIRADNIVEHSDPESQGSLLVPRSGSRFAQPPLLF